MLSQGHHANTTVNKLFRDTLVLIEHNQVKAFNEITLLFSFPIIWGVTVMSRTPTIDIIYFLLVKAIITHY